MTEFLCVKEIGGIKPCGDDGKEQFNKWKLGTTLMVDIKRPRNSNHHRKFFALLNITLNNQDVYATLDELRTAVILDAGFYDVIALMNGTVHLKPRSISFAAMPQDQFDRLYSAVIDSCLKLLKNTTKEEIEREIAAF